jgi:hypothetical protein
MKVVWVEAGCWVRIGAFRFFFRWYSALLNPVALF